jgi:4-hydroxy-tetrahydrodipicolinate reductase
VFDLGVLGSTGRIGSLVCRGSAAFGFQVARGISGRDGVSDLFGSHLDVVIDFSSTHPTMDLLLFCLEKNLSVPLVIGTTGLSSVHFGLMGKCGENAAVFYSPNMSLVVHLIMKLLRISSKYLLQNEYDVEILDVHRRLKKDSPSGTALKFAEVISSSRGEEESPFKFGLEERCSGDIGISSQRCGGVFGKHEVSFVGQMESLKITHEANSAEIFSNGALRIAKWIIGQKPGLYLMDDFVGDL